MISKKLIKNEYWSEDYVEQMLRNNIKSDPLVESMVRMLSPLPRDREISKCLLEIKSNLEPKVSHSLFVDELRLNNYHDFKQKNFLPAIRNSVFIKEYNIFGPILSEDRFRIELKVNTDGDLCFQLSDESCIYFDDDYISEEKRDDKRTVYVLNIDLLNKNKVRKYLISYVSIYIRHSIIRAIEINSIYRAGTLHKNDLILEEENENEVFLKRSVPKRKYFTPILKERIKDAYKLFNKVQDIL